MYRDLYFGSTTTTIATTVTNPTYLFHANVTLRGNLTALLETQTKEELKNSFKQNISTELNIEEDKVTILDIQGGSIIVDFLVVNENTKLDTEITALLQEPQFLGGFEIDSYNIVYDDDERFLLSFNETADIDFTDRCPETCTFPEYCDEGKRQCMCMITHYRFGPWCNLRDDAGLKGMVFMNFTFDVDHNTVNANNLHEHMEQMVHRNSGIHINKVNVVRMRDGSAEVHVAVNLDDVNGRQDEIQTLVNMLLSEDFDVQGDDSHRPSMIHVTMYDKEGETLSKLYVASSPTTSPDATRYPPSESPRSDVIIGASVGGAVAFLLLTALAVYCFSKGQKKPSLRRSLRDFAADFYVV